MANGTLGLMMQSIGAVIKKKATSQTPAALATVRGIEPIEAPTTATNTLMDNPIEAPGGSRRKPRGMIGAMGRGTQLGTGGLL